VVASRTLVHLAADESTETWTPNGDLSFGSIGKAPICMVFRDDGQQAYVSLQPSGLAIVDVPSMSIVDVLPTDGFIACGMIKAPDGQSVVIASSGGGGHIYTLDLSTARQLQPRDVHRLRRARRHGSACAARAWATMSITLRPLKARFTGLLLGAAGADFEAARRVWNGAIDRTPAVIARCARVDDVRAGLTLPVSTMCSRRWPQCRWQVRL
jgi:hypothetical protein